MDYQKNQDLLFNLIKDKGVLKQDVFSNIILNFKVLKSVLKMKHSRPQMKPSKRKKRS